MSDSGYGVACCNNPDIQSSTHCDWCNNCGWSYDYINNEESPG